MQLPSLRRLAADPIPATELLDSLASIWRSPSNRADIVPRRIGICVSGGADSMSLAFLLRQIQAESLSKPIDLTAFIVDHQARHGSAEEANTVAAYLSRYQIRSQILKIEWPSGLGPYSLTDFETQARRQRYRIVARASVQAGIQDLLLGHHQDDLIETVIFRLTRTARSSVSALQALAKTANIPCCSDMFQSTHSIGIDHVKKNEDFYPSGCVGRLGLSRPNLWVHRPLLNFSKARILATCEANDIPYVNDQTNFDPTVTTRNAIRYLRSHYDLPHALQDPAILDLNRVANKRLERAQKEANILFHHTDVLSFDVRSGTARVRLPSSPEQLSLEDPRNAAVYYLKRLLQAICPPNDDQQTIPITDTTLSNLFPTLEPPNQRLSKFTVGKVLMTVEPGNIWHLSRRPFALGEIQDKIIQLEQDVSEPGWSNWILYDERYWVRVRMTDPSCLQTILVRPYNQNDVADVHEHLAKSSLHAGHQCRDVIRKLAPGHVQFTLPVIADKNGILAFPTLDIQLPFRNAMPEVQDWKVRFRTSGPLELLEAADRSARRGGETKTTGEGQSDEKSHKRPFAMDESSRTK